MRPLLCLLFALTAVAAERPNIVVILADDYGYGSAGCYGADPKLIRTPAIDRLAAEGRRFTDGNTTSSVCSPTRYSLLTGRYCWRTTLTHEVLGTFSPLHIEPGRVNLASLLKAKGYATAAVGKWHLGYGKESEDPKWRTDYTAELSPGPSEIGFDYHFGVPANHGDLTGVYVENRFVYGLRGGKIPAGMKLAGPAADSDDYQAAYGPEDTENGKSKILDLDAPRRKNVRVMKVITDKATAWLEAQPKDRPFFLYFTPVAVHNPVTPDKELAGSSAAGAYGDWIHELDASVGRILATLDKMGATKDTLVLFTSDNGGVFKPENERLLQTAAFKAGLKVNGAVRGGKHDVWEGGFKVPFIARWPGKVPAGSTAPQMVSVVDILATTAEIVGAPLPAKEAGAEDSRSFLPALIPGAAEAKGREDMIVHSADGVFALRKGRWKWIEGAPVDEIADGARKARRTQHRSQLYDLVADPAETKDVSAEHPGVVAELKDLLRRYRDGGFSRELPAADVKPLRPGVATLPDLTGKAEALSPLASAGEWTAREGGLFAQPKGGQEKPASLRSSVALGDGVFDCEVNLQGANRVSLRFGAGDAGFRLVVSRAAAILTKNPSKGEPATATEDLAKRNLKLAAGQWYPVRLTFKGDEVTVQVNDQTFKGRHPSIGQAKTSVDLLVFGASAGFRQVRVAR
ncbi:MAG: sulfatase family protein [Opitutales bacterium]